MGKKNKLKVRGIFLIIILSLIIIPFSSAKINVQYGGSQADTQNVNINIFDTANLNTTNLNDVNTSNSPNGNDVLTWDAGQKVWTARSAQAAGDTNETARFTNLVTNDCPGGQLVIGVQNNGTVLCATDATGAGGTYNATYDSFAYNQTDVYTAGSNITVSSNTISINITSLTQYLDTLYQAVGTYITGVSGKYLYTSGTNILLNETELNATIDNRASGLGDNSSWNESLANTLYAGIEWGYNQTYSGSIYNISYESTYNISYESTYNATYDSNVDTNETVRFTNMLGNCSANQQVFGFLDDGTKVCVADATGAGGKDSTGYLYNDSVTIYLNGTLLNTTISQLDTTVGNNGITLVEANITDLSHTVDTDTNVSTICSGADLLLGNTSCIASSSLEGTHTVIWDTAFNNSVDDRATGDANWDVPFNASFDQRDSDTTYTAGSNLSLTGTVFSLNVTSLTQYLDTLYQAVGNYLTSWDNNLAWKNATNTFTENQTFNANISADYYFGDGSQLTNLPSGGNPFDQDLNTTDAVRYEQLNITNTGTSPNDISLNIVSRNPNESAVWITGNETGKGTLKITHTKPTEDDSNSAGLSIDLQGVGTLAQGVYISSAGNTSGDLIHAVNYGENKFQVDDDGNIISDGNITFSSSPLSWIKNFRGIQSLSSSSFFFDSIGSAVWYFRNSTGSNLFSVGESNTISYRNFNVTSGSDICITGGNCLSSVSGDTNWDVPFNASFDQRDSDTTYTAGTNLSLIGTTFSLNTTALTDWLGQVYQSVGTYLTSWDNNLAWRNATNTFAENQNFSKNITISQDNRICLNGDACTSYIINNGTDVIIQ